MAPLLEADGHLVHFLNRQGTLAATLDWQPKLVVEAAGQGALAKYGIPILLAGVPLVAASVGALTDDNLRHGLVKAAKDGGTRLHLPAGAIAGIDALAALPGPIIVEYIGTKPSNAWPKGTPDGAFFQGTARQAASQYPKNANVAATLALAAGGTSADGLDSTKVILVSDPQATGNAHEWTAKGNGSEIKVAVRNLPTPHNPSSSALTVHSLMRTVRNLTGEIAI